MKFLIYSNAPTVPTGYGVQCAQLATRLKRAGHDVAVACTYGHQQGVVTWPTPHGSVTLYPSGMLENSLDIVAAHAEHFFEGDHDAGWIIVLNDVWALTPAPLEDFKVLAWCPVDHFPAPEGVIKFFHKTQATPIAMSRYGEKQLIDAGLNPLYAPLGVDTEVFKPTFTHESGTDARTVFHIPQDAFVVLMVAMNKDPFDRKGFNEAFRAFAAFWREHPEAVLVVHSDWSGNYGSGINLKELARHAAIPPHALVFTEAYALRVGFPPSWLAALYTAADVLLAPSKGEGFGVPMVESQACGTPVIASGFTSQTELVGEGWTVGGQLCWDAPQSASYLTASQNEILARLMECYRAPLGEMSVKAREFALQFDVDTVFDTYWQPILDSLEPRVPVADKPIMESVDIIVPLVREVNELRLMESLRVTHASVDGVARIINGGPDMTYAENVNECYGRTTADWVLIVGDDVEFTEGWFEAAQKLSDRYDVIGTNDSLPGRIRNPAVANGSHADHFFVRRSYIEDEGACLDGPGVLAPECYGHWFTDKEIIELAKARGVFAPCLDSVIVHHHPGYDGDEKAREADPVYMKAVDTAAADRETWLSRVPLIQAQRVGR